LLACLLAWNQQFLAGRYGRQTNKQTNKQQQQRIKEIYFIKLKQALVFVDR